MNGLSTSTWWYVRRSAGTVTLFPRGPWRLSNLKRISKFISAPVAAPGEIVRIDGSEISELDTAGAMLMLELAAGRDGDFKQVQLANFTPKHQSLAALVQARLKIVEEVPEIEPPTIPEQIGQETLSIVRGTQDILAFIGEVLSTIWKLILNPARLRTKEVVVQLELVFVDAIPIACLVTLLIGIVVAYLFAMQLMKFGANIFIVDGVVLAMCRELSPIVIAITLAGRSGSAFTAQLGTMKINQEIDAMVTSGLSPMQVLVIPRICALIIALPLLTFVGDIVGTLGGLVISHWYVGISDTSFFERIQSNFPYKSFYFGLMKAPFFALFIAVIGCQMGLSVENNARSVGVNTTSTVVQSIVSIIVLNAIFAVLFSKSGFY